MEENNLGVDNLEKKDKKKKLKEKKKKLNHSLNMRIISFLKI